MLVLWLGVAAASCVAVVGAAPLRQEPERQACGDKLANIMSLVCSKSGYNDPFGSSSSSSSSRGRRVRRGIVDECCRNSCSPAMLRLYCRPDPEIVETTNSIRKRRENITPEEEKETVNIGETMKDFSEPTVKPQILGSTLFMDLLKPTDSPHGPQDSAAKVLTRLEGSLLEFRAEVTLLTRLLAS